MWMATNFIIQGRMRSWP